MTTDRPVLGILLMLGFCVLAPLGDAVAKILGASWPLVFLLFTRFAFQTVALAPSLLWKKRRVRMSRRILGLNAIRTALHICGLYLMFLALQALPLADAIAIAYVMPFVLLVMGWLFLSEVVGWRRIAACVVGFSGTLMVVQPAFADVGPPALLPVGVAVVFAAFMLVTRRIAGEIDPMVMQLTSGAMATVALAPLVMLTGWPAPELWVETADVLLLAAMGLLGTLAHLMMTWSLRHAPAATVAPMQYLEIPVAAAIGWIVFRDFPDGLALAGIAVTMAAGLYVIAREQRLSRRSALRSLPPAPPAAE